MHFTHKNYLKLYLFELTICSFNLLFTEAIVICLFVLSQPNFTQLHFL